MPSPSIAFQAGFDQAVADERAAQAQDDRRVWWLAAGTFAMGVSGLALYGLGQNPRYADTARALTIASVLFGAYVSAVYVLAGSPTPTLRLQPRAR